MTTTPPAEIVKRSRSALGVDADLRALGDADVLVDDGPAHHGVAPDVDALHEHRVLDLGVGVQVGAGREHRAPDGGAGDDDAGAHHRVQRHAAPAVLVVEDELGRRQRIGPREDRPLAVVEVELGLDRDEVHVRVVEGVERADVAPVAALDLARPRDLVAREVVHVRRAALDERRDDAAAHVVLGALVLGVARDDVDERVGAEDVVAHRGEDLVGRVGQADGVGGLLAEGGDRLPVVGRLDDPELVGLGQRRAQRRDGHRRAALDVLVDHLARVHAVDVVGAEHGHDVGALVVEQVEVLVDRIGRAREPARPAAHLRRHRRDVVAQQRRQPPGGEMWRSSEWLLYCVRTTIWR